MPAESSSSIPAALAQLAHAEVLQEAEAPHLLAYLATIPDPRASTGRRHPLIAIVALAAAAVLTAARSITAIAEWTADAPQPVRAALGARRDAPDHYFGAGRGHDPPDTGASGCRRLGGHDRHVAGRPGGSWQRRRAVAVDGKTLRGTDVLAGRSTCWR